MSNFEYYYDREERLRLKSDHYKISRKRRRLSTLIVFVNVVLIVFVLGLFKNKLKDKDNSIVIEDPYYHLVATITKNKNMLKVFVVLTSKVEIDTRLLKLYIKTKAGENAISLFLTRDSSGDRIWWCKAYIPNAGSIISIRLSYKGKERSIQLR